MSVPTCAAPSRPGRAWKPWSRSWGCCWCLRAAPFYKPAIRVERGTSAAMNQVRLSDHAYAGIVEFIKTEGLEVGARLPAEAKLAERFGISRAIVREALVRLAADGITEARRGAGSYVKRRPSERLGSHVPMDGLAATLGTYEVRFVLEAEAARLAAQRRSDQQMDAIEAALEALRAALLSSAPAHDEDWLLPRAIAESTGNTAFVAIFDLLLEDVIRILRAGVEISRSRPPEVIGAMMDEHDAIVDAI